ncbi:3-oxoacyl-ACP synthase [Prevotella sp. E13-27]|nr:3-oxoacyl-ACP synthase [Prevotella sp. E13-27]
MILCLSNNVITPLGGTTEENYRAVNAGRSALCRYEKKWGIPEPFTASLFTDEQLKEYAVEGLTRFESLVYTSATRALESVDINISDERTLFVLSTTKANVELLKGNADEDLLCGPATAAKRIAERLGVKTEPIVVCNACISGVAAMVTAMRMIDAGYYDKAIICGADVQNKFTVSGFQSLKAVSEDECRPFDIERLGLNLGEAAATMIVKRADSTTPSEAWVIESGAVRNDAFHISSPSKNGEGARLTLEATVGQRNIDDVAFINAHGTATMFNDQMESVAIERAGLNSIPVNGLKGVFGHTLGAAGLLETIVSMAAVDDHTIVGTRGFEERGVSGKVLLSAENKPTDKHSFIKMISGFGGCNGAVFVSRGATEPSTTARNISTGLVKTHSVHLTPTHLTVDGVTEQLPCDEPRKLTALYKKYVGDYPKFYKMDGLCKLGFMATELLLNKEGARTQEPRDDRAVVLINNSSSIDADDKYLESIVNDDDYFPSPSVFVYTLPNIVTGEIAMRNQYRGETSFYITDRRDDEQTEKVMKATFGDGKTKSIVGGWIDYQDDSHFEADIFILENKN